MICNRCAMPGAYIPDKDGHVHFDCIPANTTTLKPIALRRRLLCGLMQLFMI